MVGDNDAGAFGTYTQAGQNHGNHLLWIAVLLVPVLFCQPGNERRLEQPPVSGTHA
jgi:Mn2+/Fe2+ NRAMP family transporter